jgi:hypothetical protein
MIGAAVSNLTVITVILSYASAPSNTFNASKGKMPPEKERCSLRRDRTGPMRVEVLKRVGKGRVGDRQPDLLMFAILIRAAFAIDTAAAIPEVEHLRSNTTDDFSLLESSGSRMG